MNGLFIYINGVINGLINVMLHTVMIVMVYNQYNQYNIIYDEQNL